MGLRLTLGVSLSTLALGLSGLCVSAQPITVGEPIVVGQRFQIRSDSMSEGRSYLVHRPADYDITNTRYPVLIVLDGNEHFQHVSTTVDFLTAAGRIPAMLVIGIPNTDRDRDMDSTAAPDSSPFLNFITDELVPTLDRDYRTQPYRILVGHSGAGLYTLYSMINASEVFRAYIVIAPAFGDNRDLPKVVDAFLQQHPDPNLNADVFLTTGDSQGQGLSGAWELSSYLQERASRVRDLRFTFRRYVESHAAVPLLSVYEGLQSIFEGWDLHMDEAFALYEHGGLTAIDKHFAALSARLGFPVAVPDGALIGVFGNLEYRKRFAEAEQVINKAIGASPDSAEPLYYAGRVYMQMGNNPLAVETLKKSLQLSPNYGPSRGLLRYMNVDANELVPEVRVAGSDLSKYVGGYGTSAVVFEIERRGDQLIGKTSQREYELSVLSSTTFSYSENNVYSSSGIVSFRTDDGGSVTGLMFQNGPELAKLR
jgi:tetratricopeptide (TPR) repeat protein